jgi:hypothetical protein
MLHFFAHLLPGGTLVMPFMKLWKEGFENKWRLTGEKVCPGDGAVVKRWSRNHYDKETQFEHTEDRYAVIMDGITIANEYHVRSPATREYPNSKHRNYIQKRVLWMSVFIKDSHDCQPLKKTIYSRSPVRNLEGIRRVH